MKFQIFFLQSRVRSMFFLSVLLLLIAQTSCAIRDDYGMAKREYIFIASSGQTQVVPMNDLRKSLWRQLIAPRGNSCPHIQIQIGDKVITENLPALPSDTKGRMFVVMGELNNSKMMHWKSTRMLDDIICASSAPNAIITISSPNGEARLYQGQAGFTFLYDYRPCP